MGLFPPSGSRLSYHVGFLGARLGNVAVLMMLFLRPGSVCDGAYLVRGFVVGFVVVMWFLLFGRGIE